jgi:hypothetical protein
MNIANVTERDISNLQTKVNENAADIAALSTSAEDLGRRVTANAATIASNNSAIGKNTTEINALKGRVSSLESAPSGPTTSDILNAVYPVGSVYIDANNAAKCPMAAVMSGSTWIKIGSKLLTEASNAPVVGNGKTIRLADDTGNDRMLVENGYGSCELYVCELAQNTIGTKVDLVEPQTHGFKSIGLATSGDTGIVAKLSEATGLTVTLWKRTK